MTRRRENNVVPLFRGKPTAWMAEAACAGMDSDLFFAELARGYNARHAYTTAIETCQRCPVRQACEDFAQTEPVERHGVWGGLTPEQRRRARGGKRRGA